jgi:hypothetical protein
MPTYSQKEGQKLNRFEIPMLDGLNMLVGENLAKKTELGFIENARSERIGWLTKRKGFQLWGQILSADQTFALYDFLNSTHNLIRVSSVKGVTSIYLYNFNNGLWVQLTGAGTNLNSVEYDFATGNDRCFIVSDNDINRYIEPNGSTVITSADPTGQLYNAPRARLINYYRGRLYLADFLNIDGSRSRTWIAFSSPLLGLASLVSGDQTGPITTLNTTTTQYILPTGTGTDQIDFYRGPSFLGTATVVDRSATTLTLSPAFNMDLQSSDEIWIAGTHNGTKTFRWDNRATGINAKEYDTTQNLSNEDITLMKNIDMTMLIFTNNSISAFDGTAIRPVSPSIGCVNRKTFVYILGQGVFLHRTGIYSVTSGSIPRLLTAKIQDIFDNATGDGLGAAVAASDDFSYYVHIGDVPFYKTDGSLKRLMKDVVVEYNFRQNNVFVHSGIPMTSFISFSQNNKKIMLFAISVQPSPVTNYESVTTTEFVHVVLS